MALIQPNLIQSTYNRCFTNYHATNAATSAITGHMEIIMNRVLRNLSLLLIAFTFVAQVPAVQAAAKINTLEKSGLFGKYKESGIAIRGFDTVAYFTQGKSVKGSTDFEVAWSGATWQFSSQEHADLFKSDPEAYAPQYGGYCAYGVAQDYLVKIEGEQWKIEEGKLYLNYDKKVQRTWTRDIPGYISSANSKFDSLLKK